MSTIGIAAAAKKLLGFPSLRPGEEKAIRPLLQGAYSERRCEWLLRYFGDDYSGPCGNCDRCEEAGVKTKKVA